MNAIQAQPQAQQYLSLAGPGFRDFTRIAASDPNVWRDILLSNQEEVLAQARHLRTALDTLEAAMRANDSTSLRTLIQQASSARAGWQLSGNTAPNTEASQD